MNREEMIESNLPLVHSIANRFKNRGVEYDDLYQAGCVGLLKAVNRFDEERGFCFSTYAVPVIMGEIRRLFRDGGAVKVSRALKEKSMHLQKIREEFIRRNNREPSLSELSDLSGYPVSDLPEILNVSQPVLSLSRYDDDGNEEVIDIPVDHSDRTFNRIALSQALSKLNERDRNLILLRYYYGKTQCETADILHISQVQVSRKEKTILLFLRQKML